MLVVHCQRTAATVEHSWEGEREGEGREEKWKIEVGTAWIDRRVSKGKKREGRSDMRKERDGEGKSRR